MSVEDTLRAWGILRPEITVRATRDAGLELAAACTCLFRETSGGRMVWGSDGAPTARRTDDAGAVIYAFGGPVTPENYLRYRAAQRAGLIPRQGVGDCQLTSEDYLARAEALGGPAGPADPYYNQRAGFAGLAAHIARYGDRGGFVAYNGGPGALSKGRDHPAQVYGDKALAALATWRTRIGNYSPPPAGGTAQTPGEDWFAMASEADLRRIVEEVVARKVGELDGRLNLLVSQLVTGEGDPADPRTWGWGSWGGGTDERLTPVDYWRRSNVETRQTWNAVRAAAATQDAALGDVSKQVGELAAEVRSLRSGGIVLDPGAGGALPTFEITGTARPIAAA